MRWLKVLLVLYGLINIVGGAIGFVAAKSLKSLLAGGLAGVLILVLVALSRSKPALAYRSLGLVSLLLIAFWVYRATEVSAQGKSIAMPLINIAMSLVVFAALALAHFAANKKRESPGS